MNKIFREPKINPMLVIRNEPKRCPLRWSLVSLGFQDGNKIYIKELIILTILYGGLFLEQRHKVDIKN